MNILETYWMIQRVKNHARLHLQHKDGYNTAAGLLLASAGNPAIRNLLIAEVMARPPHPFCSGILAAIEQYDTICLKTTTL